MDSENWERTGIYPHRFSIKKLFNNRFCDSKEPTLSLNPVCLFPGVGNRPKCPLFVSAQKDWGQRRRLACSAAWGLDWCVVARAVHELAGVLQRGGAGCPSVGPLPAPGLPPQWLPCTCDGPRVAQGGKNMWQSRDVIKFGLCNHRLRAFDRADLFPVVRRVIVWVKKSRTQYFVFVCHIQQNCHVAL